MKLVIWHNLLWSRYKAGVFSALHRLSAARDIDVFVHQIAETAADRAVLSPVDRAWHDYDYDVLFQGNYAAVPRVELFRKLISMTFKSHADLVILAGFERPEYWLQALTLKLRGKRFAVFCDSTLNDNPQSGLKSAAKRLFFSMCSGVFCYGERSREYLIYHGVPKERIFQRRQAAALPRDYTPEGALNARVAAMAKAEVPRFLYVGRLAAEKSLDTLLKAFAISCKTLPKARLAIVGKGPEESALRAEAERLGIAEMVEFAGSKFDQDLTEEYQKATALVLPSLSEPWGLVVNEALSFGCPVVVSERCGCVPELVVDGVTGFAHPWGDTAALADRMLLAVSTFADPEATARACIGHMAGFTPAVAATGILDGVDVITKRDMPREVVA
ncbi:glycosyltransferase [Mesorhizobium sp. BR1-1-16]|uniref:glycosyltransferase n=1 Tax=Mesorhizobium sp. BR1-1-16 TaxID=2876653 RepID=UPI001CCDC75B|nr:glycosyltransferase [Mesorhizobium sp. BR1-1-16]MBZ9937882.1 glycosyltransferase [Mesorhizobium sp. BR1-1-16]